jgi:hypothetical protein
MRRFTLTALVLALLAPVAMQAQEEPMEPGTLIVSYWKCEWDAIGTLVQRYDSLSNPINQELVNEGILFAAGMATHDWADEWNVLYWSVAADKTAAFAAFDEFGRRYNERNPEPPSDPTFLEICEEHKDAIYTYGPHTDPPPPPPGQ